MGTRAIILFKGKPLVATHWDGYPKGGLGDELRAAKPKTVSEILRIAEKHTIDSADLSRPELGRLQTARFRKISRKTKGEYSVEDLRKLQKKGKEIHFGIQTAGDYPLGSLDDYDDFAEYAYNIDEHGHVKSYPLHGTWKQNRKLFESRGHDRKKIREMV